MPASLPPSSPCSSLKSLVSALRMMPAIDTMEPPGRARACERNWRNRHTAAARIPARRQLRLRLFRLDAGLADDLAPALRFFPEERAHLRRCAAAGIETELLIAIEQLGILHCLVDRVIELGDDPVRCFRRRRQRIPGVGVAARYAGFRQCRHVRDRRYALVGGNR